MASSGTFSKTTYGLKISVDWKTLSRDLANNKTKLNIKEYVTPVAGYFIANAVKPCSLTVNGSVTTSTKVFGRVENNQKVLIGEREVTITHANDGSSVVSILAVCDIGMISYNGRAIPSIRTDLTNITLDPINRLSPVITNFSILDFDKTSVYFRADATHAYGIDISQYSLNNGPWTSMPSSKRLSGLTQNTTYTLKVQFRAGNGLWVGSSNLTFKTDQENQDPPVFVSINATALTDNSISVISKFTQSGNLPVTKSVSINNGASYPYKEGQIGLLTHDTTYPVKVKAVCSNGQVAYSSVVNVKTLDAQDRVRQFYGVYKEGVVWKKTDGVLEVNPDYLA